MISKMKLNCKIRTSLLSNISGTFRIDWKALQPSYKDYSYSICDEPSDCFEICAYSTVKLIIF